VNTYAAKNLFDLPDGIYEITVKTKSRRSLQANKYYFGVCVDMIRRELVERGYDVSVQETHEFLKAQFNSQPLIDENTGELLGEVPRSTTDLNKEEFGDYIQRIQRFAAEKLSIVIPDPGEQMMLEYE
jgi:hypothetical protein